MRSVFLGIFLLSAVWSPARRAKPKVPRAPDGHPDLQGTWDFAQLTPFERPGALRRQELAERRGGRGVRAAADRERQQGQPRRRRRRRRRARLQRLLVGLRQARREADVAGRRSAGRPRAAADAGGAEARNAARRGKYDNPEERPLAERCVLGFNSGPPMIPSAYNNNMQLVQTRDTRRDPQRDDPQRAHRGAERPAAPAGAHPIADRRFDRPLGRRHAGRRHHQLLAGGRFRGASSELHLVERFTPRRSEHAALRVHGRRSVDVDGDSGARRSR